MRNEVRNMDASVKARLKNIAKEYKQANKGTVLCLTTLPRALAIERELGTGFANLHNIEVNMNI